ERAMPVPQAAPGARERALRRAVAQGSRAPSRRGFWLGAGFGAAVAASLAAVFVALRLEAPQVPTVAIPEVTFAVNEVRGINVAVQAPEPLTAAEIRVSLIGAIDLEGYPQQRELRWTTDLDRGMNQLTLPIVARDASGGQVLVEVMHGGRRRTFVVDVHAV